MSLDEAREHLRLCGVAVQEPLRRGAAVSCLGVDGYYIGHSPAGTAWIAWRLPGEPETASYCRVDEMSLALDGLLDGAARRDAARREAATREQKNRAATPSCDGTGVELPADLSRNVLDLTHGLLGGRR